MAEYVIGPYVSYDQFLVLFSFRCKYFRSVGFKIRCVQNVIFYRTYTFAVHIKHIVYILYRMVLWPLKWLLGTSAR